MKKDLSNRLYKKRRMTSTTSRSIAERDKEETEVEVVVIPHAHTSPLFGRKGSHSLQTYVVGALVRAVCA